MGMREDIMAVRKDLEEVKNESFVSEILKDYKKANKRQFIIILVLLGMFTALLGYTIYLLNDIGTINTTETYDMNTENGNNNFIGGDNNGNIENN